MRLSRSRVAFIGASLAVAAAGLMAALGLAPVAALSGGPTPYDGQLFSLTNQDRASNGLAALGSNTTLAAIAQSRPYYGCSVAPIYGRAADMLNRDYFSHQIPGCSADGGYVWPIMSADGVDWQSAGENIGWNSGYSNPAAEVNTAFMNSAPHRANILGDYSQLGTGSWYTTGPWNYPGSGSSTGYSDVYMFAEEFALVVAHSAPPPPRPTPSSTPAPSSSGASPSPTTSPTRTSRATPTATAAPTPTPALTPGPVRGRRRGAAADFPQPPQGFISSTIEQVISGYLDE
ncbi:MAG: hypothetical protein M0027_01820 [Candidatus Dormibacteraeota bacterium]|nr:hypothetical protein [Candidatus Dormibacteraeota bacterium]